MPRKLKTYQTSLGFYDLAIAAPSMKAALEAWGAGSNLFHQGVAKESGDPEVVAATMSKPGVVLRRPVGSDGPFSEHADLPTDLAGDGPKHRPKKSRAKSKEQGPPCFSWATSRRCSSSSRQTATDNWPIRTCTTIPCGASANGSRLSLQAGNELEAFVLTLGFN